MTSELIKLASTPIGARRLNLITAINENVDRAGFEVSMKPFELSHDEYHGNYNVFLDDLRWFENQGWVWFEADGTGISGVVVKAAGSEAVRAFKTAREDIAARVKVARDNYLRWLYDCDMNGDTGLRYEDFRSSKHGSYLGVEFTDQEIGKAASWLIAKKYMTGNLMSAGYYTYPKITTAGSDIIEGPGSLAGIASSAYSSITNVNVNGSHGSNVNVGGSNVTQTATATVKQVQEAQKFVESGRVLAQHLGLSPDLHSQVLEVIEEVEVEAATPNPKKNVLVELMAKARDLAVLGTATGMVNAFEQVANGAIAAIGG
ncbi:hypothetical protein ACIPUB_19945 [Paeniglutamicibacter sp. ORCA_105]|uniref:hypothetical protein n=1 Tax=Paeniglutamicibacter sp. ORCA_105 TaxID=3377336 RepID=UPI0038939209